MSNDNKTDSVISMEDFEQSVKEVDEFLSSERLLEQVKQYNLDSVLIAGLSDSGEFRFFSNFRDPKGMVFLLEAFKMLVTNQVMDNLADSNEQ